MVGPGELITAVTIPRPSAPVTEVFEKYAQWRGDFAEASVAIRLQWRGAEVSEARVAFGEYPLCLSVVRW